MQPTQSILCTAIAILASLQLAVSAPLAPQAGSLDQVSSNAAGLMARAAPIIATVHAQRSYSDDDDDVSALQKRAHPDDAHRQMNQMLAKSRQAEVKEDSSRLTGQKLKDWYRQNANEAAQALKAEEDNLAAAKNGPVIGERA